MMTEPVLIVGIGHRYRTDDALGCMVAASLQELNLHGVQCVEHDGEPASLIECWQQAESVILVDAVSSGAAAGTIYKFDLVTNPLPEDFNLYSTHAFGVPQAVELARALGKLPQEISFIGVEGACFDAGEGLSPIVAAAKEDVVAELAQRLVLKEKAHA